MNILVTVVVPVYNVEKTLDRCIESIINQTYTKIEIILVDDGSTDSSSSMCDNWAKKDERIVVVHKDNEGLGMARNTGIDYSKGDYICFCDSDDYLELDTVESCVEMANKTNADIIHYGFVVRDLSLKEKKRVHAEKDFVFREDEIKTVFLPAMLGEDPRTKKPIGVWMSLCGSFISRDCISHTGWRCASERKIISEDMYSLLILYNSVKVAAILAREFYNYCENPKSLTHTYRKDRIDKIKQFYQACTNICEKYAYGEQVLHLLSRCFVAYTISAIKQIVMSDMTKKEILCEIRETINDSFLQEVYNLASKYKYSIKKSLFIKAVISKKALIVYWMCRA